MKTPRTALPSFCLTSVGSLIIMVGALMGNKPTIIVGVVIMLVGAALAMHLDYLILRGGRD